MGRQKAENLHRDCPKGREGKRGKEKEQRSEKQISEDRRGTYIGITCQRKRGKEQEQRSEYQVSEDRWGDREQRTYIGIDI